MATTTTAARHGLTLAQAEELGALVIECRATLRALADTRVTGVGREAAHAADGEAYSRVTCWIATHTCP